MGHTATRRLAAGTLALGLGLTACSDDGGGAASVETAEDVVEAVVSTLGGSFTATQTFDLDVDVATLRRLAELDPEFSADDQEELEILEATLESSLASTRDGRSTVERAEDGSVRFGAMQGDELAYDVRVSLRELFTGRTLTPEVGVLLKVDLDQLVEQFTSAFDAFPEEAGEPGIPSADELRAQAEAFLPPGPLGDTARAILDGEYGGVVGTLDLASFGASQADLDEFLEAADDARELFGPGAWQDLMASAIGVGDVTRSGGSTTVTVDARPRDAMTAVVDFLEDNRATILELDPEAELPDDLAADFEAEFGTGIDDLPEVVPGVATLTFDGDGHLTRVEMDLVALGSQLVALVPDRPAEADQALAELEDATAVLRIELADFGAVDTVMDVDATTIEWADLAGLMSLMG